MGTKRYVHLRGNTQLTYPWEHMGYGDYFDAPVHMAKQSQLCTSGIAYAKRHPGFRFSCSTLINSNGQRVHRVVRIRKNVEPKED